MKVFAASIVSGLLSAVLAHEPPAPIANPCAPLPHDPTADVDTDGDGLSDFQEIHKYFTDPNKADTDGDGIPDGDWDERREYTYTVRTIVRVLPPFSDDVLHDDYQDARVLERTKDYVELEVIHYPLNTVGEAILADSNWREHATHLHEYVEPGLTANWDEDMQRDLVAALRKDGIDASTSDDRTLVERASKWLLGHAKSTDGFTVFCTWFPDHKPAVYPGLEPALESGKSKRGRTIEEQWQHEIFAKGMYASGERATCSSSAIYLDGCLRALGIPTRIVLMIPMIDASDERQIDMVHKRITNESVRRTIEQGLAPLRGSFANHTFNEVWVGGRWRRLNYERLGQNTLDGRFLGLMTHIATFGDWSSSDIAKTWGVRQTGGSKDDVFGGPNPYTTLGVSDRYGAHFAAGGAAAATATTATAQPETPAENRSLLIDGARWSDDSSFSADIRQWLKRDRPYVLLHIGEGKRYGDVVKPFTETADLHFTLTAEGHKKLSVQADRGGVTMGEGPEVYVVLTFSEADLRGLAPGVKYALHPENGREGWTWRVEDRVRVVRAGERATPRAGDGNSLRLDRAVWSDDESFPADMRKWLKKDRPYLLLHVADEKRYAEIVKPFTQKADLRFALKAEGREPISLNAQIGGVTMGAGPEVYVVLPLAERDLSALAKGVEYTLRPENGRAGWHWEVADDVRIARR